MGPLPTERHAYTSHPKKTRSGEQMRGVLSLVGFLFRKLVAADHRIAEGVAILEP